MPAGTNKSSWEERLRDAANHVESDLKKLVTYLNDEVVPDVRRNGSVALRAAATELQRMAERMDRANGEAAPPPPTTREP